VALVLVGLLAVAGGVRLASAGLERSRQGPVPPVLQPSGPPAAVAPTTFVGQVGDGPVRRTVIVDAASGRVVRQVPGSERRSELATDAVVAPDLRSMYLPADGGAACGAGWTQVDLTTGARRPAFGGLTGVGAFSLSADGRTLAYLHASGPSVLDQARMRMVCRFELVVRDLAGGSQRVWTIPERVSVEGLQLSPDASRLVYLLDRGDGGPRLLHLLPLARPGSVTDGDDLPAAGDCGATAWRFLDDGRLLALGSRGCGGGTYDNLLARYDLETRELESTVPLGLPVEPFAMDVDQTGRHVLVAVAGRPNSQRPATVYEVRDDGLEKVPFAGDCWQADW
jgi:hypothetical protein